MQQANLFDSVLAGAARSLARYLQPRTICLIILDCERVTIPCIYEVAKALRAYLETVWPAYQFTPLPDDPYFTVEGRFHNTYGKEEYRTEYLKGEALDVKTL
jgi:hypothetical protein